MHDHRARLGDGELSLHRQTLLRSVDDSRARVHVESGKATAVCICTRDRPENFVRCAESVLRQKLPAGVGMTLVVVDNSSNGTEKATIEALAGRGPSVIYVHEPRPGIPIARNAAIETALAASATHIVFIDDDEVAPAGWLSRLIEVAESTACDVVHGGAQRCAEGESVRLASAWRVGSAAPVAQPTTKAATNNVLFRSWIVAGARGLRFDTGMRFGGSDGEFFMRARDLGAVVVKTDDAPVFEEWSEDRASPAYLRNRAFRNGANCNYRYRKNRGPALAAGLLGIRAAERMARGIAKVPIALCLLALDTSRARKIAHKGSHDLSFAWGCLAPYLGMEPRRYY